jgi:phage tail-like protein
MTRRIFALCVVSLALAATAFAAGPARIIKPNPALPPGSNAVTFSISLNGTVLSHVKSCGSIGSETEVVEVRNGNGTITHVPGNTKYLPIVCTEILTTDKTLADWRHDVEIGNVSRENGVITLLDSTGNTVATFNFMNAWPSSLVVDGVDASSGQVITETVNIVVDALSRQ